MIFDRASPFQPFVFPVCTGMLRLFLRKILVQQLYNLVVVHAYGTELAVKRGQPHIKINCSFVNLNGLYGLVKDAGRNKMRLYLHT